MSASSQILVTQAASLEGYWPCDETSGTTIADQSGNSRDLTLSGTPTTDYILNQSGRDGASIRFTGSSGYATRTDSVLGNSPTLWTLFAIVNGPINQNSLAVVSLTRSTTLPPQISILTGNGSTDDARSLVRNDANVVQYLGAGGAAFNNEWHSIAAVRTTTDFIIYVDGIAVDTTTAALSGAMTLDRTTIGALVRTTVSSNIDAYIQHVAIWSAALSSTEIADIHEAAFSVVADIAITAPTEYSITQRSGSSGNIEITGTYNEDNNPTGIEARFNNGEWTTLDTMSGGSFSGTLNVPEGQGILEVRYANDHEVTASVNNIGVGDIYVIFGQSNASGRGINNQSYSHDTLIATQYTSTGWIVLADPVDANVKSLDDIADDTTAPSGSVWPLVATLHAEATGVPIGFIQCAKGGQQIEEFLPGADHQDRTTLYGSMVYNALQVGSIKGVLYWQGESDAEVGISQSVFNASLDTIANAIYEDLGVKMMVAKLQTCTDSGTTASEQAVIRSAIDEAWADNDNILAGPDLIELTSDDGFHIQTNSNLDAASELWWNAINSGFYNRDIFYISGVNTESVGMRVGLNSGRVLSTKSVVFPDGWQNRFDETKYYGKQN